MNKSKMRGLFSVLLCVFLLGGGAAFGQENAGKQKIDIAEAANNGVNVSWLIKVPYESATLTVSAPNGEVYRREFKAGTIPVFSPVTERGEYYGNGQFTYQIVLTPALAPGIRDALARSRIDGNSKQVRADLKKRGLLPDELVESGTFSVLNGQIIMGGAIEEPAEAPTAAAAAAPAKQTEPHPGGKTPSAKMPGSDPANASPADIVHADDVIINGGSLCVGIDCNDGENFGFDTVRLKENNLRLHFDDTSNSASFPNNDWRLTANDSDNGGQNRFSIEDATAGRVPFTIVAGAPANSLYINNAGRIGFNTSTPATALHARRGDTPTLRLEQDGSSGFTPQTWDLAGNDANFFVRDATTGRLPFRIRPGAPANSLFIQNNGNVGLGNESPTRRLDVSGGIRLRSDVLEFPDGTTQSTAAAGGGVSPDPAVSAMTAQQFYGGQAIRLPLSTITPVIDTNSFGLGTGGQAGFASLLISVPSNDNLASTTAGSIIFRIRYRDGDGTGAGARVRLDLVANDIATGARTTKVLFDSNTNAATGFNTVTICQPLENPYFNYATHGTHIAVTLIGNSSQSADFHQVQIYKTGGGCMP